MSNRIFHKRQSELKEYLNQNNIDIGVLMSPISVRYYTGLYIDPQERFLAVIIDVKTDESVLFVPALELNIAERDSVIDKIIGVSDIENPYEKLNKKYKRDISKVAIEKAYVSVSHFEEMGTLFPGAKFTSIDNFIAQNRLRKTNDEIKLTQKAIGITEEALNRSINQFVPGMTELELKSDLEQQMFRLGATGKAFETGVLSGENTGSPHGVAGHRKINNGDFLIIDIGASVEGYCADITRTFIVGKGSEKQIDIYNTVQIAVEIAFQSIKVGEPLLNIDLAARDYIEQCNYGKYFNHRIGHGLGLEGHELPSIHSKNKDLVEPGMLFTIEPGIYIPEFGGVRIEDNIFVNENGEVNCLSSFTKKLIYLNS